METAIEFEPEKGDGDDGDLDGQFLNDNIARNMFYVVLDLSKTMWKLLSNLKHENVRRRRRRCPVVGSY